MNKPFILFTNKQKREFATRLHKQFELVFQQVGRKMSATQSLQLWNSIYAMLGVSRNSKLPPYKTIKE